MTDRWQQSEYWSQKPAAQACRAPINPGSKFQNWQDDAKIEMKERLRSLKKKAKFVKRRYVNPANIKLAGLVFLGGLLLLWMAPRSKAPALELSRDAVDVEELGVARDIVLNSGAALEEARVMQLLKQKSKMAVKSREKKSLDVAKAIDKCQKDPSRAEAMVADCHKHCLKAKTQTPRPTTAKACQDGCEAGFQASWDLGCSRYANVKDGGTMSNICRETGQKTCTSACGPYTQQFPRPFIGNTCYAGCREGVHSGCEKGMIELAKLTELD
ncbi:unnamed protein product [Chrysoparadoxa australica]